MKLIAGLKGLAFLGLCENMLEKGTIVELARGLRKCFLIAPFLLVASPGFCQLESKTAIAPIEDDAGLIANAAAAAAPGGTGIADDLSTADGIPWNNSGYVDTGSGYDIRSGKISRTIEDFTVAGGVGDAPLKQTRFCYAKAQKVTDGAVPKTIWISNAYDYRVTSSSSTGAGIIYPNGTFVKFGQTPSGDGVTTFKGNSGGKDRVRIAANGQVAELWLEDGCSLIFSGSRPSQFRDPHGLVITLTYGADGLSQATDTSGRYISFQYYTIPGSSVRALRRATGSDGQWAEYTWTTDSRITAVAYNDGTSGSYTYDAYSLPNVFRDTRASARMQAVKFNFTGSLLTGVPNGNLALALMSESNPDSGQTVSYREAPPDETWHNNTPFLDYTEYRALGERTFRFDRERLLSYTDFDGGVASFTYGPSPSYFITRITDPLGRNYDFVNEAVLGKHTKVTFSDGNYRQYTYSNASHPYFTATVKDELGRVTTYTRNTAGVVTRVDYPDGSYETWSGINSFNQATSHRLKNGATEWWEFDAMGRLTKHWLPSSSGQVNSVSYTYYASGNPWVDRLKTETDARGNVTTYEYDLAFITVSGKLVQGTTACAGRGLVTKITNPDATYKSFGYDPFGNKVWEENELRQRTSYEYDSYNRLTKTTDPTGVVNTNSYNISDGLTVFDATSHTSEAIRSTQTGTKTVTQFTHDSKYRVVAETPGAGTTAAGTTTFQFNLAGSLIKKRVQSTSSTWIETTYDYDLRDRKRHEYAPLSRTTEWQYDAVGNLLKTVFPDSTFTTADYDSMNRAVHSTDEMGKVTGYIYYPSGKTQWIIDPNNNSYSFWYDDSDRQTYFWFTNATQTGFDYEQTTYDAAGNVATFRNRSGAVKTSSYDNRNRVTGATWNDGVTPPLTYTYDAAGRTKTLVNSASSVTYNYDAAGRQTSDIQAVSGTTSKSVDSQYNTEGLRSWIGSWAYGQGFSYNSRAAMTSVNWSDGSAAVNFSYREDGSRTREWLNNGTNADYGYDSVGRLNSVRNYRVAAGSNIELQTYGYDSRDRRVWMQRNGGNGNTYSYQADSQLTDFKYEANNPTGTPTTWVTRLGYSFDGIGNRLSTTTNGATTTYVPNHANQYTSISGIAIQYGDGRGNVTQFKEWALTYDAENRLISAVKTGTTITFAYDGKNRLVKRVTNGAPEYFLYDGMQILMRFGTSDSLQSAMIWGPNADEPLIEYTPTGGYRYFHLDGLGSVESVTDGSRNVLEQYRYDPFGGISFYDGNMISRAGSVNGVRYLFTGQEWIDAVGMHNFKNRIYSPAIGRFLQADPARMDGKDINLYRYVKNNPVNCSDPLGLVVSIRSRAVKNTAGLGAHTWVQVDDAQGKTTYSGIKDSQGKLGIRKDYAPDANPTTENPETSSVVVPPPEGMTDDQWDTAVRASGEQEMQTDGTRDYELFGGDDGETSGNCHVVTREVTEHAGGTVPENYDPPGANPGLRR